MQENKFSILIVDDTPFNVLLLGEILSKQGYTVYQATSGPQGREIAQIKKPDIILLDILMPGEDGFETCAKLQANPVTADIPIIFISALDDVDSKVKALAMGGWDYIPKPFQTEEVLARVRNYLRLRHAFLRVIEEQTKRLQQIKDAQQAILVTADELPEACFAVHYIPALEAGGDFYDVFPITENLFVYFVADISGHDLGASFATSALKALIRQNSSQLYGVDETMRVINKILGSLFSDGQHLTAIYAVLDKQNLILSVVNAAHLPLLLLPKLGAPRWIEADSDVMGAFEDGIFIKQEIDVNPGDRFFLITDGLVESFVSSPRTRSEGLQTLEQVCLETREQNLQEATNTVINRLFEGNRQAEDDVLLLGVDI